MNARIVLAATMLMGSFVGGIVAASRPEPTAEPLVSVGGPIQVSMLECAGGYHTDRFGDCQPDNGIVDSRCPNGFEAAPSPSANGYRCIPEPQGY